MTTPHQPDEPVRPAAPGEPAQPTDATDPAGRTGQHAVRRVPPPPTGQVPVVSPPGPQGPTERPDAEPAREAAPATAPLATTDSGPTTDGRPTTDGAADDEPHPSDRPERDRDAAALAAQREERRREESAAEPPKRPGAARHLLGTVLGLVLTPLAVLLTGIGTARLAETVGDPSADTLGLVLLVAGLLLLAVVVLLGVWSPAVPIVGGLVWGVGLGVLALVLPGAVDDAVEAFAGDRVVPALVDPLAERAMSGELLVTGTVLVAAGLAAAMSRRKGRRWAEGVADAEASRRELTLRDQARLADHGRTA